MDIKKIFEKYIENVLGVLIFFNIIHQIIS
ncbi:uncharacterized protein METZ01_LOCUS400920, partial [marine metagenome]